jgi:hypothetical protein
MRLAEGWDMTGGKKLFLITTTVMPAGPRFFWAPKKIAEKFFTGIFFVRIFELMSATTTGLFPSGPGSRDLGNAGNSTPSTVSLEQK